MLELAIAHPLAATIIYTGLIFIGVRLSLWLLDKALFSSLPSHEDQEIDAEVERRLNED